MSEICEDCGKPAEHRLVAKPADGNEYRESLCDDCFTRGENINYNFDESIVDRTQIGYESVESDQ